MFRDHGASISWREFDCRSDDVPSITRLLHRAYAELGDRGLNYTAVDQTDHVTLRRLGAGIAMLGWSEHLAVATCTLYLGTEREEAPAWYRRPDCAFFGQFAVLPEFQRRGLGSYLCHLVEDIAKERGKDFMALDTAEPASHLIAFYERLGYRRVDTVRWPGKTYRSVIMAKSLVR